MQRLIPLLCLLLLPGCPELRTAVEGRGVGYLLYSTEGSNPMRVIRKVGLIERRPGAAVRYEGILEDILLDDIPLVDGLVMERARARGDGQQVFFYFQSRADDADAIVRVFDVRSSELLLDVNARRFAEDAFAACDVETPLADILPEQIRFRGIDTDIPYDVEYEIPPRSEVRRRNIFPSAWTTDGSFVAVGAVPVRARVSRDGVFLTALDNVVGNFYLSYAFGVRRPVCATEEPDIGDFSILSPAASVARDIGERPRIVIGDDTLYAFPTDRLDDARPLNIPDTSGFFIGFFRPPRRG